MTAMIEIAGRVYQIGKCWDLSIPLDFRGPQPNAYGVPTASATPFAYGSTTLSVAAGGSCNCDVISVTPHCNGTHTECVGHITRDPVVISAIKLPLLMPATVITVTPESNAIHAAEIEKWKYDIAFTGALIIRSLPNDDSKRSRAWLPERTPFLTPDAMKRIRDLGVKHLLVDLPSVDPLIDGGVLKAHRTFWNLPSGSTNLPAPEELGKTITEMIYVPNDVPDGPCVLALSVLNWMLDAAPSRPLLHSIEQEL